MEFNPVFLKLNLIEMDDVLRNPHLNQTCRRLSFGPGFGMTRFLDKSASIIKDRSIDALAILAHYHEDAIGWLLFTHESDHMCFSAHDGEAGCHIFIDSPWRRKGIGTRLLRLASRLAAPDTLRVYAHENKEFFDPIIESTENIDRI